MKINIFKHWKRKLIIAVAALAVMPVVFLASAQVVDMLTTETVRGWNYTGEKKQGGETTAEFHGKWMNYLADSGWKGIDTAFYRTLDGYTMKDAPFEVYLPFRSTGIATFHNNNKWDIFGSKEITDAPMDMTMQALGVNDVSGYSEIGDLMLPGGMAKGISYVVYSGAYADGDLIYYVHHGRAPRLEKLIRFSRAPQPDVAGGTTASYQFKISYPTGAPEFHVEVNGEKKKWNEQNDEEIDVAAAIPPLLPPEADPPPAEKEVVEDRRISDGSSATTSQDIATSTLESTENPSPQAVPSLYERENNGGVIPPLLKEVPEGGRISSGDASTTPTTTGGDDASTTPKTMPTSTVPALFTLIITEDGSIIDDGSATTQPTPEATAGTAPESVANPSRSADSLYERENNSGGLTTPSVIPPFLKGAGGISERENNGGASTTPESVENPSPQAVPSLYERENDAAATTTGDTDAIPPLLKEVVEDRRISPENNGSGKGNNLRLKKAKITNSAGKAIAVNATGSDVRGISFKKFQIWDSNEASDANGLSLRKIQPIQVDLQPTTDGGYILTKIIPIDFFTGLPAGQAGAVFPVFTDTTTTFYPDPSVEVTSVDGDVFNLGNNQSFAATRADTGGGADNNTIAYSWINSQATTDNYQNIYLAIYLFDTSSISSGSSITSATFSVYGFSTVDNFSQSLVLTNSHPASNTALAAGDYTNHVGTMGTEYGTARITVATFSTTGYNDFTVNATGLGNIATAASTTKVTKFGTRLSGDFDNVAPTWVSQKTASAVARTAETASTTQDPKLTVVYVPSAASTGMWWGFVLLKPKVALAKVWEWIK